MASNQDTGGTTALQPPDTSNTLVSGGSVCSLCKETMNTGQECIVISECTHPFHKSCIETHLATASECPVCQRACELSELRSIVIASRPPPNASTTRGRGRGSITRQYCTRSTTRNLNQFSQGATNFGSDNPDPETEDRKSVV